MKKLIPILLTTILTSCSKYTIISESYSIDYSKYYKEGFFVSESNTLSKEYEPVASVIYVCRAGYEVSSPAVYTTTKNGQSYITRAAKYGKYKVVTAQEAIDAFVAKAKELGANGVINFQLTVLPPSTEKSDFGFSVTGMAIKIE